MISLRIHWTKHEYQRYYYSLRPRPHSYKVVSRYRCVDLIKRYLTITPQKRKTRWLRYVVGPIVHCHRWARVRSLRLTANIREEEHQNRQRWNNQREDREIICKQRVLGVVSDRPERETSRCNLGRNRLARFPEIPRTVPDSRKTATNRKMIRNPTGTEGIR